MKTLAVHIQPERIPEAQIAIAIEALKKIVAATPAAQSSLIEINRGPDYANVYLATAEPAALWQAIEHEFQLKTPKANPAAEGIVVLCEGEDGWNDYLMLYHFDPSQTLDRLAG